MGRSTAAVFCLAYMAGLLSTATLASVGGEINWEEVGFYAGVWGGVAVIAALVIPRIWRTGVKFPGWLVAGLIAILAIIYLQLRIPQPGEKDISRFIQPSEGSFVEQVVTVRGKVFSAPRLTRSQRVQFWLTATQVTNIESQENSSSTEVTGKVYVTVPLLQGTGVVAGQPITVTGNLYQPQSASNPGSFDFRAYLGREGAFAGLSGEQVRLSNENRTWGWWRLRQRIIRAQVQGLGSPMGQVMSSIVLGRRAVDLPFEIRDAFLEAGLAHVLAASGFHVSLLLGVILTVTRSYRVQTQLGIGLVVLAIYVMLTGLQPSVMRAAVMGVGALFGLATDRKVNPLGSLLLAATILLLWNPLWIWDLGFQLSFLATLGLVVTVPRILPWFDWLPPTIATLVAVPIAVFPWVMPLQLYAFGVIAPYSVVTNIVATPLVVIVSLGGMISGFTALILPILGSAIALILHYPILLLVGIVQFSTLLPGSTITFGTISITQLILLYGLILLVWQQKRLQKHWCLVAVFALTIVVIPIFYRSSTLTRVSVLATPTEQVLVIQNQGNTLLINSGGENTAQYIVLPFLRQQGITEVEWALALTPTADAEGWKSIAEEVGIKAFFSNPTSPPLQIPGLSPQALSIGEEVEIGNQIVNLISGDPAISQLQIQGKIWLLISPISEENNSDDIAQYLKTRKINPTPDVFIWSGERLDLEWLKDITPKNAIAISTTIDQATAEFLHSKQTQIYWTEGDGAIQWTLAQGLQRMTEISDSETPLF